MTRICTCCNQSIGEKCACCGTEATPLKTNSDNYAMTGTDFDCPSCGHHFVQGDGGETGGMCELCLDALLRRAHEQTIKEAV